MLKGPVNVVRGIIILIIGGTAYTVSQADVVNIFSEETGMSQVAAEQYVENISDDELASFYEIGLDFISYGEEVLNMVSEIDCVNYFYEWETATLTCEEGKSQLNKFGNDEIALGEAYKVLSSESASEVDIYSVIRLIDSDNENYSLEIVVWLFDYSEIDEAININLYNKALLRAALDSE